MAFQEINRLRKSGRLKEAYALARDEIEGPKNTNESDRLLWAKRGMAWVLYDYLKRFSTKLEKGFDAAGFANLLRVVGEISQLDLPTEEGLFYEQFTWKIAMTLKSLEPEYHGSQAIQLFQAIRCFNLSTTYEPYRVLLLQFHRMLKNNSIYMEIVDWWNIIHFQYSDFQGGRSESGKPMPSLAQLVYTNYYKHLAEKSRMGDLSPAEISSCLKDLDRLIESHPEFDLLHYRKAQLLQALQRNEEAIRALLPYLKKNRKRSWVWELMGDLHSGDAKMKTSCYCKALSIPSKEDLVSHIRIKLAEELIHLQFYDEAKTEIERYYLFKAEQNYKQDSRVDLWRAAPWYENATLRRDNRDFYTKKKKDAAKLLYLDLPEQVIVVEAVNRNKKILNFMKSRHERGFFNYDLLGIEPQVGDVFRVRMEPKGQEGYHILHSWSSAPRDEASDLIRPITGIVDIRTDNPFGFVNNGNDSVFVDRRMIQKFHLSDGTEIDGWAIAKYDRKKKKWGWSLCLVDV